MNIEDIQFVLKKIEKQRPENEVVSMKIFTDGSGIIASHVIDEDFEPNKLYEFDNIEQLADIIYSNEY